MMPRGCKRLPSRSAGREWRAAEAAAGGRRTAQQQQQVDAHHGLRLLLVLVGLVELYDGVLHAVRRLLEIWGDMGRYGEIWGDMGRYEVRRLLKTWGDTGRYGEIWGDTGRYGEVWGEIRSAACSMLKSIRSSTVPWSMTSTWISLKMSADHISPSYLPLSPTWISLKMSASSVTDSATWLIAFSRSLDMCSSTTILSICSELKRGSIGS